jgi:hypothetical protein
MDTIAVIGTSCPTSVEIPFIELSATCVLLSALQCKFCRLHHKGSPFNPCCKQRLLPAALVAGSFLFLGFAPTLWVTRLAVSSLAITAFSVCLQVRLHGVLPVNDGSFQPLQQCAAYWNDRLKQAAAVCNSLTWVSKRSMVGDDLERKLFDMVEAQFVVRQGFFFLFFVVGDRVSFSQLDETCISRSGTPAEHRPQDAKKTHFVLSCIPALAWLH